MQTFLPYPDFDQTAQCLDRQRLGKQRVECLQLLQAMNGQPSKWANHPCFKMWVGHLECLVEYGVSICDEWIRRGYKDTCRQKIIHHSWGNEVIYPSWFKNRCIFVFYRKALLFKNPSWYSQFQWNLKPATPDENGSLNYPWPT